MVLPGPPGGRVRRRRPTFGPTPASTLVEAGVGLFVRLCFYRTFHAETQRKPRGRQRQFFRFLCVLSVPLRLCVKRPFDFQTAPRSFPRMPNEAATRAGMVALVGFPNVG